MEDIKVAFIQGPLVWEDIKSNVNYFDEKINNLDNDVDLVILPEMFSTGFTMNPEKAYDTTDGFTVKWMQDICIRKNIALTGSIIIKENEEYFNRLFFVFPDGKFQTYDKRHLFTLSGENKKYSAGKKRLIVTYKDWNICPLICYDLRFPAFARNTEGVYDLLIYVGHWPDQRKDVWNTLLKARAIENISYVVGVNRTGVDCVNYNYSGYSQVLDYLGQYLVSPQEGEVVSYAVLKKSILIKNRSKLPYLKDADTLSILD